MPGASVQVGRLAGIPVGISPWWLAIVALITWSLGASYYPDEVPGIAPGWAYALGLASALLLFASILAHEIGHAVVARRRGVEIEGIDLWLLGGVARMRGRPRRGRDELAYAAAGPLVTLAVCAVFGLVALALPADAPRALVALVEYQALVNGAILVFNLLPAFPLDGGRILHALVWMRGRDPARATRIAAAVGRAFGVVMIGLGVLAGFSGAIGGLWLALIGWFVIVAGAAESSQAELRAQFEGCPAAALMSAPAVGIRDTASAAEAAAAFASHGFTAFPVVDAAGRAVGLVTLDAVAQVPVAEQARTPVADLAVRDPALLAAPGDDVAELLDRPAFARVGRLVVVGADGRPAGLLSITDVQRRLRAMRALPARVRQRTA